ncbi:hypothetical protein D3C72_2560380 [compost metagenome]
MRRADGDFRESINSADQAALWSAGVDIAAIDLHRCAKRLQALDEQVHRTGTNGTAAGQ